VTTSNWQNGNVGRDDVAADQLLAHPLNWRIHVKAQQDALVGSLDSIGWVRQVLINQRTGHVVDGHLRVALALRNDEPTVPVVYVDLSEAEEMLVLATLDPIAAMAHADAEVLSELLVQVETEENALQALLVAMVGEYDLDLNDELAEEPNIKIDKAAELQQKWQVRQGDIWEVASNTMPGKRHRVMCADNTDEIAIQAVLMNEIVAMFFIDPPYGIELDTNYLRYPKEFDGRKLRRGQYAPVVGDEQPFDARPLLERFDHVEEVFLWGADNYADTLPNSGVGGTWYVWDKRVDATGGKLDKMFGSPFELCWGKRKRKKQFIRMRWAGFWHGKNTDGEKPCGADRVHPTQKPAALAQWFIERFTKQGELVFDCFLGAGWTLAAAEKCARVGIGMEIEPRYVAFTLERMATLTGQMPVRVVAGGQ